MRLGRTRFTIYSPAIGDQLLKHEAYGTSTVRVSEISTLTNYRAEKKLGCAPRAQELACIPDAMLDTCAIQNIRH